MFRRIYKKFISETPLEDKLDGQFCTKLSMACAGTLTYIVSNSIVVSPTLIVSLVFGAILFGGKAAYHGIQTKR